MSQEILSTLLSFLDINEFQGPSDEVPLLSLLNLSAREVPSILFFWLSNTDFAVQDFWSFIAHTRNGRYHRKEGPAITWNIERLMKTIGRRGGKLRLHVQKWRTTSFEWSRDCEYRWHWRVWFINGIEFSTK